MSHGAYPETIKKELWGPCWVYAAPSGLWGGGDVIPRLRHTFSVPYPGLFPFAPTGAPDRCDGVVRGLTESGIVDVLAGS